MGLFSFIKKAVGKVARAGLSIATHGASDKVLKAFKGTGGSKSSPQQEALVAKLTPVTPRTQRTETTVPGWGFNPTGYGGEKRARAMGKPKAGTPRWKQAGYASYEEWREAGGGGGEAQRRALAAPKRARKPAKARSGAKRRPPTGGLDLRALSASWRAAGKPGTWQGWIAANK